jgi:hypothetical protein
MTDHPASTRLERALTALEASPGPATVTPGWGWC